MIGTYGRAALLTVLVSLLSLGACNSPTAQTQESHDEGREETRHIRNTEAIGYSGAAIADQVDTTLDAHEQRLKTLEEQTDP